MSSVSTRLSSLLRPSDGSGEKGHKRFQHIFFPGESHSLKCWVLIITNQPLKTIFLFILSQC